jgi:hypothetical protein
MDNTQAKGILTFQVARSTTQLFKRHLNSIEDLREAHNEMLRKLERGLSPAAYQMVLAADYFSDTQFAQVRKRILDDGNQAVRDIREVCEKFSVDFPSNS